MKRNIIFSLLLLSSSTSFVYSQHFIRNGWMIGGSTSKINLRINSGEPKLLSGSIFPTVGKTFKNQSIFGLTIPFSFSSQIGLQSFYYIPQSQTLTIEKLVVV